MTSIHKKITLAFVSLAVLMALLAALAFLNLLVLENRVQQGITVTNLEHAVLEMRRQEKNLFLYKDPAAGLEADHFAAQALTLLGDEPEVLAALGGAPQITQLQQSLQAYRRLLPTYHPQAAGNGALEAAIREQGRNASQIAEGVTVSERGSLKASISSAKWALAMSVLVLAMLLLAVGRMLARSVVAPMKKLVEDLNPIAEGRFDRLELNSRNAEMVALRRAFNRMLDELEARRRRLLQSEKLAALGVLVTGVAHELNNPLANISTSSQLLVEEIGTADPETLLDWARTIDRETERARRIVDALQDFGRRRGPQFETIHLADLVERTLLLLRGPLRKLDTRIENDIPLDVVLYADPQRLQQVFINLLRNAAEGEGTHLIRLSARACSQASTPFPPGAEVVGELGCQTQNPQQMVEISVEDDGAGIPADTLPRVFEPFYTTRAPGQGMGLGLYIVQEIMQEHHGCIAIASQAGHGTRVVLRLPCGGNK